MIAITRDDSRAREERRASCANMPSLNRVGMHETEEELSRSSAQISAQTRAENIQTFNPSDLTKEHIPGTSVLITTQIAGPRKIAKSKAGSTKIRTSEISYEQFVVGHFLRYVKLVIHNIMRASLKRTEVKNRFQAHIKQEWSAWVQRKITKKHLLNSVVRFVVFNCPQAKALRINLIRDFPGWCEQGFGQVGARRLKAEG